MGCIFVLPPDSKKSVNAVVSFDLLSVLFHQGSKPSRFCLHAGNVHCTYAEVCSHRNLYSTLYFRLLLGQFAWCVLAYKAI
jgi:hypothetical protein